MAKSPYTRGSDVVRLCTDLKKVWRARDDAFQKTYKVLRLEDELKTRDMESFVSNDPRTYYNLALHLLTPDVVPHRIKEENIGGRVEIAQFTAVNKFLEGSWDKINRLNRRRGRQTWMRGFVGLLLATGWYSVWAYATDEGVMAEAWNPAEVYPDFGDEDLLSCAHIYRLPPRAVRRKLQIHPDWKYQDPDRINQPLDIYDYWYLDEAGAVRNVVVIGNQIAKADSDTPFTTIPILVSPVGGLPDWGTITSGDDWKAEVGQSIVATNERVYRDYNKQMSFLQQLLRDTAQFRLVHRSEGGPEIDPDEVFRRGAIIKIGLQEELKKLEAGAVPVDVRTALFDIQGMIQRGALPWALYGNVQQEIASYLMSQIASAAHQVLDDYRDGIRAALEDGDKMWLDQMQDQNLTVGEFKLPPELPEEVEVDVGVEVSVPGDLIQRVNTGRMANPMFKLSEHSIIEMLFPEIRDPLAEQAKAQAEIALQHPIAQAVANIQAWRSEALRLRKLGMHSTADLFEKSAAMMEAQLTQEPSPDGQRPAPTPRRETTAPQGETAPREVTGAVE